MTYYLIWWLCGWAFSVWATHLVEDVTLGAAALFLLVCMIGGPLPGVVYLMVAANPDIPIVLWKKRRP